MKKKIIVLALVLVLIASMTVTAHAVTPKLDIPDLPEIPDLSGSVKVELSDSFWDRWFADHPIKFNFSSIKFGG